MNKDKAYLMSMIEATKDLLKLAEEVDDPFGRFQLPIRLTALKERLEKLKDE